MYGLSFIQIDLQTSNPNNVHSLNTLLIRVLCGRKGPWLVVSVIIASPRMHANMNAGLDVLYYTKASHTCPRGWRPAQGSTLALNQYVPTEPSP